MGMPYRIHGTAVEIIVPTLQRRNDNDNEQATSQTIRQRGGFGQPGLIQQSGFVSYQFILSDKRAPF
ncbi:hypothetical protein [Pseudomonas syringae]|uniref:hypothetical protein n=1 Tax=Pseudomonas syringae TaxID=317 RepID=UPI003F777658